VSRDSRGIVAVVVCGAFAVSGFGAAAAHAGSRGGLHLIRLGAGDILPDDVVVAPDGTPWFADYPFLRHVTADGRVVVHRLPRTASAGEMVWGRDGALWAIDRITDGVIRITADGDVTRYPRLLGIGGAPENIIAGPDGAMWFGDRRQGRIMSVRADGSTRTIAQLSRDALPELLVSGADGSAWYTDVAYGAGGLGRVLPDGRLDAIRYPHRDIPSAIVASNGDLWFIRIARRRSDDYPRKTELVRLDTRGDVTAFRAPTAEYWELTVASDGSIWMAGDGVVRLDPKGRLQRIRRTGGGWERVDGIAAGADGRVWLIFGQPFDTDTAAPVHAGWLPSDPCLSQRQLTLRLRPHRGERIRSATVSLPGQPNRTFRGRHRLIPVDLRGYLPGTVHITVKVSTTHRRYTRRRAYRTC
jgi:virginiamycin B lyase